MGGLRAIGAQENIAPRLARGSRQSRENPGAAAKAAATKGWADRLPGHTMFHLGRSATLPPMTTPRDSHVGRWHITSVEGWEKADIDLLGPASIEFDRRGNGKFQLIAVTGDIDYRLSVKTDGPVIEWSWIGDDDGSEISGRGWAHRQGDRLAGEIFVHRGEEFAFEAMMARPRRTTRLDD